MIIILGDAGKVASSPTQKQWLWLKNWGKGEV